MKGITRLSCTNIVAVSQRKSPIGSRLLHQRGLQTTATTKSPPAVLDRSYSPPQSAQQEPPFDGLSSQSGLSMLPLSQVLRTWLITSISSSPPLLNASTSVLRSILESRNPLWQLDRNPLIRAALWHTFYLQFCTGEKPQQVAQGCADLRRQGYSAVILEYALEVLKDSEDSDEAADIAVWRKGMLDTVAMAGPGDFIGLKWSGMGPAAMRLMAKNEPPTPAMSEAMHALCDAAAANGMALLPAAEETWTLDGFNAWSLGLQREYNVNGRCVVYNTYQAYLKRTPQTLAQHLELARREGYTPGIKLVRGAYLGSEERSNIWPTIEDTHRAYNTIAKALLEKRSNEFLPAKAWPEHHQVMLATHNAETVRQMQELRQAQAARGEELVPLAFAQLMGMADEVSCRLIAASKAAENNPRAVREKVFKCTTWGPMYDCLNYLLRRAAENKDAAGRTHSTRDAMKAEVWRRIKATFGLA